MIHVNLRDKLALQDLEKYGKKVPEAFVRGTSKVAIIARNKIRRKTYSLFKLHSDYIPKGVMALPETEKQIGYAIKKLTGRSKFFTSMIFLRGSTKPEKSLDFMVPHEEGERKLPQGTHLALPGPGLDRRAYKSARGKVKKMYKPETLLSYFNKNGPFKRGDKKSGKGGKPKAFILYDDLERKKPGSIVRRKTRESRDLETLYTFKRSANIRARWGFVKTTEDVVSKNLTKSIKSKINKIRI